MITSNTNKNDVIQIDSIWNEIGLHGYEIIELIGKGSFG